MKVSCVMPTYRRFNCVERSISFFLSQETELETELIILNTDVDHPLFLDETFSKNDLKKIIIINNNLDYFTKELYTNTGAIRRDAFTHATGEYYITWDDDDIFLPWNIQQCYDGLERTKLKAWKPDKSFAWLGGKDSPEITGNYLEASVMLYSNEVTFNLESGPESLSWFNRLKDDKQLIEDCYSIPSYCFYWKDNNETGGHKQSSTLSDPNNFFVHMDRTKDYAKSKLTRKNLNDYKDILIKFDELLFNHNHKNLVDKYVRMGYYNV
jgi:glycosyltransferase involved in cell wall biosynthesis